MIIYNLLGRRDEPNAAESQRLCPPMAEAISVNVPGTFSPEHKDGLWIPDEGNIRFAGKAMPDYVAGKECLELLDFEVPFWRTTPELVEANTRLCMAALQWLNESNSKPGFAAWWFPIPWADVEWYLRCDVGGRWYWGKYNLLVRVAETVNEVRPVAVIAPAFDSTCTVEQVKRTLAAMRVLMPKARLIPCLTLWDKEPFTAHHLGEVLDVCGDEVILSSQLWRPDWKIIGEAIRRLA
ncbi:MAG: hypothetical protein V2A79_14990 [Planctomycetota bacterium]